MKNLIMGAIALTVAFSSCKKEKDETTPTSQPEATPTSYYKLKVGNYWVYERWTVDTNGTETNTGFLDSAYVLSDTTFNGNTYYDYRCPPFNNTVTLVRDSSGYLVGVGGEILSAPPTNTSVFRTGYVLVNQDTLADVAYFMTSGMLSIAVPAGNFQCVQLNVAHTFRPPFDVTLNNGPNPKTFNEEYANGEGKVRYSYYYTSMASKIEDRLLRYFVQ